MKGSNQFLAEILDVEKPGPEPELKEAEAISLADMDGKYATLRPDNKAVMRLHVVDRPGNVRSFQYVHLDSDSRFGHTKNGQFFVLRFIGSQTMQVTVHGRNLWRLYDYIVLHRWPYLRVADRDFAGDKEAIVTAVDIEEVREAEGEKG